MNGEDSDSKNPRVSIILPTYNRAHLISDAIDCVLHQTYTDFELVIIDDASSDDTAQVIESFRDSRLRYHRHEANKGGAAARNTGIVMARGDLIAFQDSDDEWLPSKLAIQVKAIEDAPSDVGAVYVGFLRVDAERSQLVHYRRVTKRSGNIHEDLLMRNFITTSSLLVRREKLIKIGLFDENLPRLQDWDLVMRLSKDCSILYIDEPLVVMHLSPDSVTRDVNAGIEALELILDKHYEEFAQAGTLSHHCYSLSRLLFSNHQYEKGLFHLVCGVKLNPLSIGLLTSMVALFPGGHRIYEGIVVAAGR